MDFFAFCFLQTADVAVVEVPAERQWYAKHVIVASANSSRHLFALAHAVQDKVCGREVKFKEGNFQLTPYFFFS